MSAGEPENKAWYHVTIAAYGSWLPGDPRGFRTRDHKLHSSGDHRQPPPPDEHAGLLHYSRSITKPAVRLPSPLREALCRAFVTALKRHQARVIIVAVGGQHLHALAELSTDRREAKWLMGVAKKSASQAIGRRLPERMWAKGCGLKRIRDESHQRNTFYYIKRHENEGAFVWTYLDSDC